MFFAVEPQVSRVDVSSHAQGLFKPSQLCIRRRNIALCSEHVLFRCANANGLVDLRRFEEAKSLLRKTIPIARRVLGDGHELTLRMRSMYSDAEGKRDQKQDEPGTSSYDYKCYAEAVRIQKRREGGGA